jgi:enoyl-[acyl-carrier-protein] reductase (NADH)
MCDPTASDITDAVRFLSSDDSAFITGQTVVVDRGLHRVQR